MADVTHFHTLSLPNYAVGSPANRDISGRMAAGGEHETKGKGYPEMLGEFCREAGVLIGVFGFLDRAIRKPEPDDPSMFLWAMSVTAACLGFTFLGMWIEHRRGR